MRKGIQKIEQFLEWGGTKKDITLLVISGLSLLISILIPDILPFDTSLGGDCSLRCSHYSGSAHWAYHRL